MAKLIIQLAPFNNLNGERFKLIHVTPVLNAPFAANTDVIDAEDLQKIQEILVSDEIANNEKIFVPADSDMSGLFTKNAEERFIVVEDDWFSPIRELAK